MTPDLRPAEPKPLPVIHQALGEIPLKDIKIKQRFRTDFGDIEALAESIKELGLIHPPTINEKNELIAGYRRIKAYEFLGWDKISVHRLNLDNILRGESDENLVRKDFTPVERVAIGLALEERERKRAKERQGRPGQLRSVKFTEREKGEALEKVAKVVGWSRPTYEKAKAVVEAADDAPKKYGDLESNLGKSVESTYHELQRRQDIEKRKEISKDTPELKNLVLGDCLDKVDAIPDNSIDLLLTDPPYGKDVAGISGRPTLAGMKGEDWTYPHRKDEAIFDILNQLFSKLKKKLKDDAHIYIFTHWRSWSALERVVEKHFEIENCLVYHYGVSLGSMDTNYRRSYGMVMFASNGKKRKLNTTQNSNFIKTSKIGPRHHPTEKSVEILKIMIMNSTVEGETVLDPFAGSGSTLVAAEELDRNWIGIEIVPRWHKIAKTRILEVRHNA